MAFEGLADKLANSFKRLKSKGKLTEADVREAMREVRLALLEADVNYKVAKDFTNTVTERAIGTQVMESLTPGQMVVKIVDEEMCIRDSCRTSQCRKIFFAQYHDRSKSGNCIKQTTNNPYQNHGCTNQREKSIGIFGYPGIA